jgi:FkbM family methyltransferase
MASLRLEKLLGQAFNGQLRLTVNAYDRAMIRGPALLRTMQQLVGSAPLIYVDCGARRGRLPAQFRFLRLVRYVGFEAESAECARLAAFAKAGHTYIPAILGRARERRTFNVTSSAACSSLLKPDHAFLAPFGELSREFHVDRQLDVETVTLDECLPAHGIESADFLKLDTQGSELDILRGADRMLRGHVVGVQVEVEFAPIYVGQPLFADIDVFLRGHGFVLFDLSRYRVRRPTVAKQTPTRGQLLWGHALYLKTGESLDEDRRRRLAVVAVLLDLPDLAGEILLQLERSAASDELTRTAARARSELASTQFGGVLGKLRRHLSRDQSHVSCDRIVWND